MPTLTVVYLNHLDLTWRRPRYTAGERDGFLIAPYAEVQERQLDAGLRFVREGGCYDIEQTASLREYLERNPDLLPEVTDMVKRGRLRLLGGGESVEDSNLPDGESQIRNHLYSRLWMRKTFGIEPKLAEIPDIFGLSGGLPTLFRALGYRGILQYHRVFPGRKPYFRGVSGDTVLLETADALAGAFGMGSFVKSRVCTVCEGKGCPACEGKGFLSVLVPKTPGETFRLTDAVKNAAENGADPLLILSGEESMAPAHTVDALKRLAADCGVGIRFAGLEELALEKYAARLAEEPAEDEIDPRPEGNPMGAGCYTTRIRLKQANRRAESALRCAEVLSVLAGKYPARTFEGLWRRLAFTHFHDAITASHSTDAAKELTETYRQITASAGRLTALAAEILTETIAVPTGEGAPFLVWNPLNTDVKHVLVEAPVPLDDETEGGTVLMPDGSRRTVLTVRHPMGPEQKTGTVTFFADLPAMGYALFRFLPERVEREPVTSLENGYLRVTLGKGRIKEIYDKKAGRVLAAAGTFSPWVTDDGGNLWGRMNAVTYREKADHPNNNENMLPSRRFSLSTEAYRLGTNQVAVLRVTYDRPERRLTDLDYTVTLILPDGSDRLYARINAAFDAPDLKLSTAVVLPSAPANGCFTREIPLGEIRQGQTGDVYDGQLGHADEWPALRYIREGGLILANSGTPGHSIRGSSIFVSLLRNPTQLMCGFGCEDAIDPTPNEFLYSLSPCPDGESAHLAAYNEGMALNTAFPAFAVSPKDGSRTALSASLLRLPASLPLLALKGAENGQGTVVRYLGSVSPSVLSFPAPVTPLTVLEDPSGQPAKEHGVGKYGIASFLLP